MQTTEITTVTATNGPASDAVGPSSGTAAPVHDIATARHITALDGLRGLAVAGVVIFHAGYLNGGYLGVDLFFVLSGFLITGLLIREHRVKGEINLRNFWVRRLRRLMPALLAMLVAVSLYAAVVSDSSELFGIRAEGLSTLLYVANWQKIFAGLSYWQLFAAPSPLDHTWSLAIEEQFYFVWPFVLWGLFKFTKASLKTLLALCLGLALLSEIALWTLFDAADSTRAYEGTDTRGAAILLGAALATGLAITGPVTGAAARRILEVIASAAFIGLLVAWFTIDGQSSFLYRGGFLLTELCVLTVLVAASHPEQGWLAKILSAPPLVWLGLVSYGVYLWHWPVFLVLSEERLGFGGIPLAVLQIGVSLGIAAVSYHLLEMPIRRHGLPKLVPATYAVPAAFLLVIGVILFSTAGGTEGVDLAAEAGVVAGKGYTAAAPGATKVMVVGDSVGTSMGVGMSVAAPRAKDGPAVAMRAFPACNIFVGDVRASTGKRGPGGTSKCDTTWKADVAELKPNYTIVLLGGVTKVSPNVNGEYPVPCEASWNQAFRDSLLRDLKDLTSSGGKVLLSSVVHFGDPSVDEGRAWVDCANTIEKDAAKTVKGVTYVDLDGWVCPGGECRKTIDNGDPMRADGLHFRGTGGVAVAEWFLTQIPKPAGK